MTEIRKPTDVSFTAEDVAAAAAREQLTEGWYQFVITSAEAEVAKSSGSLMIVTKCPPLEEPGVLSSKLDKLAVRNNIVLPFKNEEWEGHTAPKTTGICHSVLRALFGDEIPDYPRFADGALSYKGEQIEKAEEDEARQEVTLIVFEKMKELWADPSVLVDQAFFAQAYMNGNFLNIKNLRGELPEDASLVPAGQFVKKAEVKVASKSNGHANGKNGHAKPAAKAAAKKR